MIHAPKAGDAESSRSWHLMTISSRGQLPSTVGELGAGRGCGAERTVEMRNSTSCHRIMLWIDVAWQGVLPRFEDLPMIVLCLHCRHNVGARIATASSGVKRAGVAVTVMGSSRNMIGHEA